MNEKKIIDGVEFRDIFFAYMPEKELEHGYSTEIVVGQIKSILKSRGIDDVEILKKLYEVVTKAYDCGYWKGSSDTRCSCDRGFQTIMK